MMIADGKRLEVEVKPEDEIDDDKDDDNWIII